MRKLLGLASILIFAASGFAQSNYKTYANARFGFSISYPVDLLAPQGEAANGDGQVFTDAGGAEMRVFGSNLLLNKTLPKEYEAIIKERGAKNISYKTLGKNFFAVSGKVDGKIFYQKTMRNVQGAFITFLIEYDESQKSIYDAAVAKMVKSFK